MDVLRCGFWGACAGALLLTLACASPYHFKEVSPGQPAYSSSQADSAAEPSGPVEVRGSDQTVQHASTGSDPVNVGTPQITIVVGDKAYLSQLVAMPRPDWIEQQRFIKSAEERQELFGVGQATLLDATDVGIQKAITVADQFALAQVQQLLQSQNNHHQTRMSPIGKSRIVERWASPDGSVYSLAGQLVLHVDLPQVEGIEGFQQVDQFQTRWRITEPDWASKLTFESYQSGHRVFFGVGRAVRRQDQASTIMRADESARQAALSLFFSKYPFAERRHRFPSTQKLLTRISIVERWEHPRHKTIYSLARIAEDPTKL